MSQMLKFDLNFIREKINEGEKILRDPSSSAEVIAQVETMLDEFYQILNINSVFTNYSIQKLPVEKMCSSIEKKIKYDLEMIGEHNLMDLYDLCSINDKEYNIKEAYFPMRENLIQESLSFYNKVDKESYRIVKSIIENEHSLINLDENVHYDHAFYCEYLSLTFISVNNYHNMYPVWLIHELRHGVEHIKHKHIPFPYEEVGPILFETLYIDELNKIHNNKYTSFYFGRINHIQKQLRNLKEYIELIIRYKKLNSKISPQNINYLLQAQKDDIRSKYFKIISNNYLISYKYILSFLYSIELRNIFYSDKKESLAMLKKLLNGQKVNIDYKEFPESFMNFSNKVKSIKRNT